MGSPCTGQRTQYLARYTPAPCKPTPALGKFREFAESSCPPGMVVSEARMAKPAPGIPVIFLPVGLYPLYSACWGPLPGNGLDPPPAKPSLHLARLPVWGDAGSWCRPWAGDAHDTCTRLLHIIIEGFRINYKIPVRRSNWSCSYLIKHAELNAIERRNMLK